MKALKSRPGASGNSGQDGADLDPTREQRRDKDIWGSAPGRQADAITGSAGAAGERAYPPARRSRGPASRLPKSRPPIAKLPTPLPMTGAQIDGTLAPQVSVAGIRRERRPWSSSTVTVRWA